MSQTRDTKANFSTGLISQSLSQRKKVAGVSDALLKAENFNIRPTGAAYFRDGLEFCGEIAGDGALISFDYNNDDGVMLVFTDLKIEFIVDGFFVESTPGTRYELTSPYLYADVKKIKFVRFYNDMYLFHENHNPKKLERLANDSWAMSDVEFNPDDIGLISGLTITKHSGTVSTAYAWEYAVSAVDKDGRVGFPVEATSTGLDIDLARTPAKIEFDPPATVTDIAKYYVYRKDGGVFALMGTVMEDGSPDYTLVDANIPEDTTIQPPIRFEEFDGAGNKPRCASFYGQRLVFAGTTNYPSRIWFSGTANFTDLVNTNAQLESESFRKDILSEQSSVITNLINFGSLFIGSRDALWSGNGYSEETINFVPSDFDGSSEITPIKTKFSLVYVDKNNYGLHDFVYSQESNFNSQDLSLKVEDYFEDKEIVDLGFARSPDPTVYVVMDDGTIMVLLYIKNQELSAWTTMTTDGNFKNVASLGKNKGAHTYFLIERDGTFCVERMIRETITGAKAEDSKNMDSFVFKESETAFTTVDGLDHLNCKEVWVVYDGNSRKETVVSGSITLPVAANKCCVGLPYEGLIETVQVDYLNAASSDIKSTQEISKRISSVWVRYKNAKAFEVSTNGRDFRRQKLTDMQRIGLTTELDTGNVKIQTVGAISKETTISIKQVEPFPTIIQGLTYKVNIGRD